MILELKIYPLASKALSFQTTLNSSTVSYHIFYNNST